MIIKTVFHHDGRWQKGEVEVHLLAGLPNLHIVGLPDAQIKESGIKLRSALKSCGYKWPQGHQIIANLRPNHFRKSSAGVELAIALAMLIETRQAKDDLRAAAEKAYVYGEVALDGRVLAPHDVALAMRSVPGELLTGVVDERVREGEWTEMDSLAAHEVRRKARFFDWGAFFQKPSLPELSLHPEAARMLSLTAHAGLHVLLAGPQGSGKTTWAKLLYGLTEAPDVDLFLEREEWVGEEEELRWKPLEQPHHSLTPLAMVGGSYPIQPGVVTRAHGGILLMDEFLEFHPHVLENLREPIESGRVEVARKGSRERLPARFQLIGTTNLCPCGKLYPKRNERCGRPLPSCSSTSRRLSGPILDRFDLLIFTHEWIAPSEPVDLATVRDQVGRLRDFRKKRGPVESKLPDWVREMGLSHRRQISMMRVARALADEAESVAVRADHFFRAGQMVNDPIGELNSLFA